MNINNSKIVLSIIFGLVAFSLGAQNKYDNKGLRQGAWSKIDKNGNLVYSGQFKDGYEVGTFTYYFSDGKTIKTKNEFSGKGHFAKTTIFSKQGQIISIGFFKDKKKDSLWTLYNEKGAKIGEERYKAGMKEGVSNYFDKDSALYNSITYSKDKKNGVFYKNMYQDGYFYLTYKNDKKDGAYEEYYYFRKLKEKGMFKNDGREGEWKTYDTTGHVVKIQNWKDDKLIKEQVRLETTGGTRFVETKDIAYFYTAAKRLNVTLFSSETISALGGVDELLDLIGLDDFIQLNKSANFFASLQAIKGIGDKVGDDYVLKLFPPLKQRLLTDKDSRKAMELMFLPQEELKK